jgi:hypothetical protein
MKPLTPACFAASILFTTLGGPAFADEEAPSSEATPTPSQVKTLPAAATGCLVVNNGLDAATAHTGGQMVCDEIRSRGVSLAPEGSATADAYRVSLDRLGRRVIVRVSFESPVGRVSRTRRLVLRGAEELTVAAPRVARAIVDDSPLEDSQRVDNMVGEETGLYRKKHGEFLWGAGILGATAPSANVVAAPGAELFGMYETPAYGVGVSLRTTFEDDSEHSMQHSSIGIGGRYFFSGGDISPFAGGGFTVSALSIEERSPDDGFYGHAEGSGFGAFAEAGVEFLRLHGSRLILGLRADAPFYQVARSPSYSFDPITGSQTAEIPGRREYHVPLTLAATYAW